MEEQSIATATKVSWRESNGRPIKQEKYMAWSRQAEQNR